jgi:hypothetical protein
LVALANEVLIESDGLMNEAVLRLRPVSPPGAMETVRCTSLDEEVRYLRQSIVEDARERIPEVGRRLYTEVGKHLKRLTRPSASVYTTRITKTLGYRPNDGPLLYWGLLHHSTVKGRAAVMRNRSIPNKPRS